MKTISLFLILRLSVSILKIIVYTKDWEFVIKILFSIWNYHDLSNLNSIFSRVLELDLYLCTRHVK